MPTLDFFTPKPTVSRIILNNNYKFKEKIKNEIINIIIFIWILLKKDNFSILTF
jgi:hypothetical protein